MMTENQIQTGTRKAPNWKCVHCGIGQAEHVGLDHEFKMKPRGFSALSKQQVQEIASKGGKAAHAQGTAHKFNVEEARAAGIKGGIAAHKQRGPLAGYKRAANPGISPLNSSKTSES